MTMVETLLTQHMDLWTSAIKRKSSAGRGSSKKIELYGIKKLRELILELAVRGLLVPQDPNDEPASELLKRIAAEKAKLVKEGKIKKEKPLPEVSYEDTPYSLPTGWRWARLGEISNYGLSDKAEPADARPDTWVLELEDVEKETSRLIKKVRFFEREFKSSKNVFRKGDVIYGKLRPYLDKVLVADEDGVCTTEMVPFSAYAEMTPEFLRLSMKSPHFIAYANSATHGMNLPRVGTDKARLALIPICSLATQNRIVAKVDELMALCDQLEQQTEDSLAAHQTLVETLLNALTQAPARPDDASASANGRASTSAARTAFDEAWQRIADHFDILFTTEQSIDQLKQTILQLAVMGKLVPQDHRDEPASELLKKIAAEKAKLVKEGKIKKEKPLPPITEEEKPFALPEGWEWCRLSKITFLLTDGAHHTPTYITSGVPFLSVKDMSSGYLDFSDTRYISEEQHQELAKRCKPEKGDLLLTKVGTTGIPVLIEEDIEFSIFVSVALIKFPNQYVFGKYFSTLIKSPFVLRQSQEGTQGIGNKNLVLKTIAEFKLAIPPLPEQHRIVAKVDELMALCDQLKARLNDAQTTQLHLADAITEQALA